MQALRNIFLFPYGGGGVASYRTYAGAFPSATARIVPVELPGRGRRAHEDNASSIQECAALTLPEIDTDSGGYVLHGHCMGALLAFEATKLIESTGRRRPLFIVASGRNAPRHVNDWLRRVPQMDDQALFNELRRMGGVPRGLSFAMARHFLTVLRYDQAMFRNYEPGATRVDTPILVLAGREDSMINAAGLADWKDYTSRFVSIEWLEGEHYSILRQADRVARCVEEFQKRVESPAPVESSVPV